MPGLSEEADRLYGLPPAEFTAARTARSRELRSHDAELARAVGALRRPTAAAASVNAIARADPDGIAALTELGKRLRAAQEAGDGRELADLVRERRRAVSALLRAAPVAASATDDVTRTLEAATVDPWAARAIASGRLLRPLVAVGFDPVDLDGAVAVAPDGSAAARGVAAGHPAGRGSGSRGRLRAVRDDDAGDSDGGGSGAGARTGGETREESRRRSARQKRIAAADAKVEGAESEVRIARDDLRDRTDAAEAAAASARQAHDARDAADRELEEAQRRAAEARDADAAAQRAERAATRDREEAEATARAALGRLERARDARDALDDH